MYMISNIFVMFVWTMKVRNMSTKETSDDIIIIIICRTRKNER